MNVLADIVLNVWMVSGQMAPYLLFGFLVAGILSVSISPELVERHLGRPGLWQVCKAALLGVPLPLCSCGVIPVAASLRQHGAGKGATLSFVASTPQTGLDSVMVTYSLLGPIFVVFRVVTAFVSGLASGSLVELLSRHEGGVESAGECSCSSCKHEGSPSRFVRIFHYGFVELARDIGRSMLVGIVISGFLSALIPENYFADKLGVGLPAMFLMMIVGIPIYACSSGSVPIAFALIHMGVSPGAALVFLVTGPATNAATITTVWKILGKVSAVVYLVVIGVSAILAGCLLDSLAEPSVASSYRDVMHHGLSWFHHLSALVLVAVLAPSLMPNKPHEH
ncbi:MAG: permease [Kiritimatiellia bacterium]|jgi:hypothetical protein|nr:permease [Kiritimatiellia bacterium]MDP6849294.1 permease [Kiritimatiellia bacterium]